MREREGLIHTEHLIPSGQILSEDTVIRLKKQELDYLTARIGLQGTLWGAWACLIVICLIVLSPTFTTRNIIEGWQIVAIVIAMVVSIVFYGTFIFNRALTIKGKTGLVEAEATVPQVVNHVENTSRQAPHAYPKRQNS